MLELYKRSVLDFRDTYKRHLAFEAIFMLATSFLFVPILAFIFNRVLRMINTGSLLNDDVLKIGLSYQGIIGLFVIGLLAVVVLYIEFGVILIIAQQRCFGKSVLIADAFLTMIRKIPKIFGFGMIQLMVLLLFLLPFIESPMSNSLLSLINLPIFFTSQYYNTSIWFLVGYALLFIALVYTVLRWIFVMHYIVLENQSTGAAIKSSLRLTRRNRIRILFYLLLLNACLLSVGFVVISSFAYLPSWINLDVTQYFTNRYSLTLTSFLNYLFTLLLIPLNIIFLTRLFYRFKRLQGVIVRDQLAIHRAGWLNRLERRLAWLLRRRTKKSTVLLSAAALYLMVSFLLSYAASDNLVYMKWHVLVAAHRGDMMVAPENSLSSIQSALDKKVDAIEIDVQMTKDGVVVLHHDYTLSRVAGIPERIGELTYEEVARIDIGSHFSEEYAGERVARLEEVLELVKDQAKLIVEIKPYGQVQEITREVVGLIEAYGMVEQCYIQSFDYGLLSEVRQLNEEIKIGQILFLAAGDLSRLDVDFYTIEQVMLSDRLIEQAHKQGREVWVWTVNIDRNLREVLKYKIDGIITDYPEKVQNVVGIDI